MKKIIFLTLLLTMTQVHATVKLHKIFGDNMVLQRDVEIPIFGYSDGNMPIKITFNGITKTAEVVAGKWKVYFPKMNAGGPYDITVEETNKVLLNNVMIGDVWICSGQSNMEFRLSYSNAYKNNSVNFNNNNIRFYEVKKAIASTPKDEMPNQSATWQVASKESIKSFSAVAYYFADILEEEIHVPIALIGSYWGNTTVDKWIPKEPLSKDIKLATILDDYENFQAAYPIRKEKLDNEFNEWQAEKLKNPKAKMPWKFKKIHATKGSGEEDDFARPSALYNAMINPLIEFPIKGVIWYQGESNAKTDEMAVFYEYLFSNLIISWREKWAVNFPFYYVQLASYGKVEQKPSNSVWARLRESQANALKLKNTGMAVAIDLGEESNIHPTYKKLLGERLALQALKNTYNKNIVSNGPSFKEMKIEGNEIRLMFNNTGSGIIAKAVLLDTHQLNSNELLGFSICGEDKIFVWAKAKIIGNQIIVSNPNVKNPIAVRYGWADFPLCNFYNKEGLPATPFRTDSF